MNNIQEALKQLNLTEAINSKTSKKDLKNLANNIQVETKCRNSIDDIIKWLTWDSADEREVDRTAQAYYIANETIKDYLPNVKEWYTIVGDNLGEDDFGAPWNILAITDDDKIYGFIGDSSGYWRFDIIDELEWLEDILKYYPEYNKYKPSVIPSKLFRFADESLIESETLDLSKLDFKHYIWLRSGDEYENGIAIGDIDGFWSYCKDEEDYNTSEELLMDMLRYDRWMRIPRDFKGYEAVDEFTK